jgi:hypothetical protein
MQPFDDLHMELLKLANGETTVPMARRKQWFEVVQAAPLKTWTRSQMYAGLREVLTEAVFEDLHGDAVEAVWQKMQDDSFITKLRGADNPRGLFKTVLKRRTLNAYYGKSGNRFVGESAEKLRAAQRKGYLAEADWLLAAISSPERTGDWLHGGGKAPAGGQKAGRASEEWAEAIRFDMREVLGEFGRILAADTLTATQKLLLVCQYRELYDQPEDEELEALVRRACAHGPGGLTRGPEETFTLLQGWFRDRDAQLTGTNRRLAWVLRGPRGSHDFSGWPKQDSDRAVNWLAQRRGRTRDQLADLLLSRRLGEEPKESAQLRRGAASRLLRFLVGDAVGAVAPVGLVGFASRLVAQQVGPPSQDLSIVSGHVMNLDEAWVDLLPRGAGRRARSRRRQPLQVTERDLVRIAELLGRELAHLPAALAEGAWLPLPFCDQPTAVTALDAGLLVVAELGEEGWCVAGGQRPLRPGEAEHLSREHRIDLAMERCRLVMAQIEEMAGWDHRCQAEGLIDAAGVPQILGYALGQAAAAGLLVPAELDCLPREPGHTARSDAERELLQALPAGTGQALVDELNSLDAAGLSSAACREAVENAWFEVVGGEEVAPDLVLELSEEHVARVKEFVSEQLAGGPSVPPEPEERSSAGAATLEWLVWLQAFDEASAVAEALHGPGTSLPEIRREQLEVTMAERSEELLRLPWLTRQRLSRALGSGRDAQ